MHSWFHPLCLGLIGFSLPFPDFVLVNASECEELFLIVNHLIAAGAGKRIIFHEEDGFFRTNLLAISAEDAPKHVNLKFLRRLLDITNLRYAARARRHDPNGLSRANN